MRNQTRVMEPAVRWALVSILCVPVLSMSNPVPAATLQPGDVVQVSGNAVLRLDPVTLAPTPISSGGLLTYPRDVDVDRTGRILIADWNAGIVRVNAESGTQTVLADVTRLGGNPAGIAAAPGGLLYVSVMGASPGVVRLSPDGSTATPVSSGGLLYAPHGLAVGPDGALYVTERNQPYSGPNQAFPHGSIVRVDPAGGGQSLLAASSHFFGPIEIAFVNADEVWTIQQGHVAGREGCFIRTRISDGVSEETSASRWCRGSGIAAQADGSIIISDCQTVSVDCWRVYTTRVPNEPMLYDSAGPMAVVPMDPVPARRSTWGTLKTIYR